MSIRDQTVELAGGDENLLFCDPPETFDKCIVGIARRFTDTVVCYDESKVLEALAQDFREDSEDPETDAMEWFEFNTIGGWIGEYTPVFITLLDRTTGDAMPEETETKTVKEVIRAYVQMFNETWVDFAEELLEAVAAERQETIEKLRDIRSSIGSEDDAQIREASPDDVAGTSDE